MIPFELSPFKTPLPYTIKGEIHPQETNLLIKYQVEGEISSIEIPPLNPTPKREEFLWKKTCFEIFLAQKNTTRYFEYNFSPSGSWECYQFFDYRSTPQREHLPHVPAISQKMENNCFTLSVLTPLPEYFKFQSIVGVSVVIKNHQNDPHFWAIEHPREVPDFHDRRSFLIELP